MASPYPNSKRRLVVDSIKSGCSLSSVARQFGISVSVVSLRYKRYKEKGRCSGLPMGGGRPTQPPFEKACQNDSPLGQKKQPSITIDELRQLLATAP